MIFISRSRLDKQGKPIGPSPDWFRMAKDETDIAIKKKENNEGYEFLGRVYGHGEVRKALGTLFCRKCAYCEDSLLNQEWDVDHYRPKGSVEGIVHPGYYWLAYQWDNLLPSCKFCNQRRKDKGADPPGPALGKVDQFPLTNESNRSKKPADDLNLEQPLLFNPCVDDFKGELKFNPKGEIIVENQSPRLVKSVEICHLQRSDLRIMREVIVRQVCEYLRTIKQARQKRASVASMLRKQLEDNYLSDHNPFAAVARYVDLHPERFGV